ncbi:hypothetical protein ABZ471_20210 [Streptomyces sp. NPDC005728]|uniref:hypothetical protein n=1 Tax=Streptomyces sp. NPDC005728 TaxID=3157054 RepID=UPI0033CE9A85
MWHGPGRSAIPGAAVHSHPVPARRRTAPYGRQGVPVPGRDRHQREHGSDPRDPALPLRARRTASARACVTPQTAALLEAHIDPIQARIDCLARNGDRLTAYMSVVRPDGAGPGGR